MGKIEEILAALGSIPSGRFVMTSMHEDERSGVMVRSVQSCADEPPLLSVAALKGHGIAPLIRDSHSFALCRVEEEDRLIRRLFAHDAPHDEDPFDALGVMTLTTGSPVLVKSSLVLDCEVVRHFDIEADHELYIGMVVDCKVG